MEQLILGDNQFFGVSHMSEERGMERSRRFQDTKSILDMLDYAYDSGIHAFSFSTHDKVRELCKHFRANPQRYDDLRLYPVLPYAHKYAHAVNEKGVLGAIADQITKAGTTGFVSMVARGSVAALRQDPIEIMKLLVDAELQMFRGLQIEAVFLQNNVADLLLGIGIKDVFQHFVDYVSSTYGVRVGFMTLNMTRMVEFLLDCGIEQPLVASAINKVGFQVNPDMAAYQETLSTRSFDAVAMSVMAAGAVSPAEAFEFIAGLPNVRSVIFGASQKRHIAETKTIVDNLFSGTGDQQKPVKGLRTDAATPNLRRATTGLTSQ